MRARAIPAGSVAGLWVALMLLGGGVLGAQAADMKFKAFLLWGTNEPKPPEGKDYKPVEAEIHQKLKDLPLKWTNWFEVRHNDFAVGKGATKRAAMSDKCELEVRNLGDANVEVAQIGKGKEVLRRKQSLGKGEVLILGGNAPNSTAWLIVLKRLE
jgi:hypothetical protein